ncbi:hypothetical protein ACPOL_5440 [Acidisarcina polymorpha]|uniref:Uncharacterized protein n=1 Tax=Acidisarcina polymorpha TaxID=2211140 RepID=A0A2Z5G6H0_9BACT|nr:hypothetical protein [Acidisarcina polymorpha]AXC14688.1 hypothetical protein ACPOL_5440 [Acidisarcina polymorpha]
MPSGRKKAIVRKLSRDWLSGYLPASNFAHNGQMELLDLTGKVTTLQLDAIKWVCFVRDFNSGEPGNPERLLRKNFAARPRNEGVSLRLRLKDGDILEGLAANDLTLLDSPGVLLTPPDIRSNTQKIFVPRSTITDLSILAVIVNSSRRKRFELPHQEDLFTAPEEPAE